tara:strand:+ start:26530 stop:26691 length:162 start_codon:yes stop_codon:yes gene_type:complete
MYNFTVAVEIPTATGRETKIIYLDDCDCADAHMNDYWYGVPYSILSEEIAVEC